MNQVFLSVEEVPEPPWTEAACSFAKKVLKMLNRKNCEVSLLLCNNRYIKSLNAKYRNMDEATDVLSFPMGPEAGPLAGDIVISLDALKENARFFKVSQEEELRRLLVHGILHLFGSDHASNDAGEPMLKLQEEILCALAQDRIQENVS